MSGCHQDDRSAHFKIHVKFWIETKDHISNNSSLTDYSVLVGQIEPHLKRPLVVVEWPSIDIYLVIDLMLSTHCD